MTVKMSKTLHFYCEICGREIWIRAFCIPHCCNEEMINFDKIKDKITTRRLDNER